MILVKNTLATQCCCCSCGDWLEHWEKTYQTKATKCMHFHCNESFFLVSAPIYQVVDDQKTEWIIPLCRKHTHLKIAFHVPDKTKFAPIIY